MIHHHIKFLDPDNVFKSKMAYSSLVYGTVLLSKYILFCKFSSALPYVMANLMLTFFNCKYIVVHRPQSDTCRVCVWHMQGTVGYRENYWTAIGGSNRLSY